MKFPLLHIFAPRRVYLDYAAATPVDPEVIIAMREVFSGVSFFGNSSSTHEEGRVAKQKLADARLSIARVFKINPDELIFTSGATESNNLAIQGVIAGSSLRSPHVITTAIEHPSIRETLKVLEKGGVSVTYLKVDENGLILKEDLIKALKKETVLITLALGNSEIGTTQPFREIKKILADFKIKYRFSPYLHYDVSQAVGSISVSPEALNCELLTIDGSKIYGPKGSGLLYAKRGVEIKPIFYGGGQEGGLRAGTENLAGAVGLAKAIEIGERRREAGSQRLEELSGYFTKLIRENFPQAIIHGEKVARLPNFVNVCFPGIEAEFTVVKLDTYGIAASSASACHSIGGDGSSYVIAALGRKEECMTSSIRFTLGRFSRRSDIDRTIQVLKNIVKS